jgi:hypothetical protein
LCSSLTGYVHLPERPEFHKATIKDISDHRLKTKRFDRNVDPQAERPSECFGGPEAVTPNSGNATRYSDFSNIGDAMRDAEFRLAQRTIRALQRENLEFRADNDRQPTGRRPVSIRQKRPESPVRG